MTPRTGFSIERGIRAALFLVLGLACIVLTVTGGISAVLHPRMHPWVLVSGVLFLALSANDSRRLFSAPRPGIPVRCYYALLLVIATCALFPDLGKGARGAIQMPAAAAALPSTGTKPGKIRAAFGSARADETTASPWATDQSVALAPNDDQYWSTFNALYGTPDDFRGKEMVAVGFVYREPRFPSGVVLVGRNLIWCCSADKGLIGFLAVGPALSEVPPNTWVEVKGRLDTIPFNVSARGATRPVPLIRVQSMKQLGDTHPSENIFPR